MTSQEWVKNKKQAFAELSENLFSALKSDEQVTLSVSGEDSLYCRFSQSKVRQPSRVDQVALGMSFIVNNCELKKSMVLSGDVDKDTRKLMSLVESARKEAAILPETPFIVEPKNLASSDEDVLLAESNGERLLPEMVKPLQSVDAAGLLADGIVFRGNQNSLGQKHWFSNESFYVDYSLYSSKQKAVKACYADTKWDQAAFEANVSDATNQLSHMRLPTQEVKRGNYKTYLAPAAVNELLGLLNWGGWSAQAFKTGRSSLKELAEGNRKFSQKMNITEDFSLGLSPKFNSFGEVADDKLSVIDQGELKTLLVSSKTAEEYSDLEGNRASAGEGLRSAVMGTGSLDRADILSALGTGLYVSNLHYLNYSDLPKARVTGMTRFACFWVENGEIKGPIKDLRFDETVYNIFGDKLVDLTSFAETQPVIGTYEQRAIGGSRVPGILVDEMAYTL
ncbi:MAG: hypothetical protein HRT45_04270 [Bdellovibrionales bacterium]|nr:hypothetical protein [Bdellovibrionales bacterium]